ncbi:MAG: hypothetical protein AAF489_05475 [Bacteroidota bacterium]
MRILGVKVQFASVIEEFIAHQGPKISYGKQPMGKEIFVQAHGLLTQQGFEDIDITVQPWEDSICFFPTSDKSVLPFDIFSAAFYLLSRYEEYIPHLKDKMARFPAEESLAYKEEFLHQPVIDIWAYRFKAILLKHFPNMEFEDRTYQRHHIVEATQPFAYTQRGFLRNLTGYLRDLGRLRIRNVLDRSKVLLKLRKDPYDTFRWMMNAVRKEDAKLSVFFLLGEGFSFKEDINTKRKKYKGLVKHVGDYTEVGLIFSYHSLGDEERLKQEKRQMEELTHRTLESSLNDKLLVNLPHNYRSLLELEVKKDMTMVYENELGFRAGTCTPFLFYDLDYEIKTPLIIYPLAGKTSACEGKKEGEIESQLHKIRDTVQELNGTFSLLFTNRNFTFEQSFWRRFFSDN